MWNSFTSWSGDHGDDLLEVIRTDKNWIYQVFGDDEYRRDDFRVILREGTPSLVNSPEY